MRDVFRGSNHDTVRRALCFLLVCACIYLVLTACVSTAQTQNDNNQTALRYQHSGSRGDLMFVGVSGRFSDREESINAALRDAARKFSFYNSVSGNYTMSERTGGSVFDHRFTSDYELHYDTELDKYIEQLEFDPARDIFENNNALFVIARVTSGPTMPSASGHSYENNRPVWVDVPPLVIDGFIAGIGYSDRQSSHRDTVIKSYERAVISIITSMGSRISGEIHSYQDTASAFGAGQSSASEMTVSGTINNFFIIESWTDPVNLSVWTLAIASNSN